MVLFANQKDLPLDLSSIIFGKIKNTALKMQILDGCVSFIHSSRNKTVLNTLVRIFKQPE
jgi:hypothetical protein